MKPALEQFIRFATRFAPAVDQKPFAEDLRNWIESLSDEERQKLTDSIRLGWSLNPQTLAPDLRNNTKGLSRHCIPLARQMLDLFNKKNGEK